MDVPDSVVLGISTFGTVMVFLMLSAQLPAMYQVIFKTKSVESLSALPSLGQMANFVTWTIYAIYKADAAVLRVNVIGIVYGLGYISVFVWYSAGANRARLFRTMAIMSAVIAAIEAAFIFGASGDLRLTLLASLSVACNVAMFAAPIAQLRLAFATMNPAALPLLLCVTNAVTASSWMLYGLFTGNWFVAGPNVAGVVMNVVQLLGGGYISLAAMRDPTIVKPLPSSDKADEDDDALLEGLRGDDDPLVNGPAGGVASRYMKVSNSGQINI